MEFSFDTSEIPVSDRSFDLIPAGWYAATVTGAESRDTKSGTGKYLRIEFTLADPAGRKVWSNYNVKNDNAAAETIGRQQLAEVVRAIGKKTIRDTDELLGCVLSIKVKIRDAANGYEASNEVAAAKAIEGSAPPKAAAPAKASPPWAKK
jgi:hypothetical protein